MQTILRFLASLWFWVELFTISALLFPLSFVIFLLTFLFDKRLLILHQYACLWSYIVLSINPLWKIKIIGREKIDPRQVYVMVSNHQSGADIIVLFLLKTHFKWVAKKSLFAFPFIGWNMWLNRYISVERGKASSMKQMMTDASRTLHQGNSVMIFPEGTRSKDGRLQSFKSGAFHLALKNEVPILPIVISGTSKAIRKGGFLINNNQDIRATVLDPVPYNAFKDLDIKSITEKIHAIISQSQDHEL